MKSSKIVKLLEMSPILISDPPAISASATENATSQNRLSDIPGIRFPIANLPYEIRQLIYVQYLTTLPALSITKDNALLALHTIYPLALAFPFLTHEISPALFYQNATFSFSFGEDMKAFASLYSRPKDVRKVRILYGKDKYPRRDWVFLLSSIFPGGTLEELTFVMEEDVKIGWGCVFRGWFERVEGAVREALLIRRGEGNELRLGLEQVGDDFSVCLL
jgi:hypothetical protein